MKRWVKALVSPIMFGLLATSSLTTGASAQNFPSRPIRVIVSTAPGDPGDVIARLIQNRMQERLGQQWLVEARPGASGRIATAMVAKAKPDGHMLLVVLSAHAINPASVTPLTYDTLKDLSGVSLLARHPLILAVHPEVKGVSLTDFVAHAKENPSISLAYASPGSGSLSNLIGEGIARQAGINMVHAPFKGGAPAVKALLANEVQLCALIGPSLMPSIRTGALRAIAVTSDKRLAELPDVPTMIESGFDNEAIYNWIGVFTTGGTPRETVTKLNIEIVNALEEPAAAKWLNDFGFEKIASKPEELDAFVGREMARWIKYTRDLGIKFE